MSTSNISKYYSNIGNAILKGEHSALKTLYENLWKNNPYIIETFSQVQESLTNIELDLCTSENRLSDEFLYYYGMSNIGEQSRLIIKRLDIAENCFEKIKSKPNHLEARISYIKLMMSSDAPNTEKNSRLVGILRKWSARNDYFSRIALARIGYYSFLNEEVPCYCELPFKVTNLLKRPCQDGHPVALEFYYDILRNSNCVIPYNIINTNSKLLLDYYLCANVQDISQMPQ